MSLSRLSRCQAYLQGQVERDVWWLREQDRLDGLWQLEQQGFPDWVVGTDEVGRGPMAGPLVAAAAAATGPVFIPGLDDSKKLTHQEREVVAQLINKSAIKVAVAIVSVEQISQGNLHKLSLQAMLKALEGLDINPGLVLVDGKYKLPQSPWPQQALVKGDSRSALIAAASIMAKVTRDQIMFELSAQYPGYGWERNVGYCTREHQQALLDLGVTPHHRLNYRPVKQLLS